MSINLLNSIINGDYVSANKLFEEKLSNIQEKKLYELKRMMQAEVFGGMTKAEIEARRKAGYRKASEVLPDPRDKQSLSDATKKYRASLKKKKVSEEISTDSSDAEMERTRQLKKVNLADMKKASREERMARIGARAERLRQRGHSDPGRHLARAYGTSIGNKIGSAIKTPAKIAAGVASDIANAVALEE